MFGFLLCLTALSQVAGCQTSPPKLKVYHNAEEYEGPGVYLFLISDAYDKDFDPAANERTFHVVLVNATGDMLFVEDLTEPPSLSVKAKPLDDKDQSFGYIMPVVRWWYRPYLRIASIQTEMLKHAIAIRNRIGPLGLLGSRFHAAEMDIPVQLPNASIPLRVRIKNPVVYSQLGEKYLRDIPLDFEFVLQPRAELLAE